ncbi:MAG: hypothetical protein OHK0039_38270 [Bacteroidia bacterium]
MIKDWRKGHFEAIKTTVNKTRILTPSKLGLIFLCTILLFSKVGVAASWQNLATSNLEFEKGQEPYERQDRKKPTWKRNIHYLNPESEDGFLKKALIWGIITVVCFAFGYLTLYVIGVGLASILGIIGATLWGEGL